MKGFTKGIVLINCDIYVFVKYLLKQFSTTLKILDKREHQEYND